MPRCSFWLEYVSVSSLCSPEKTSHTQFTSDISLSLPLICDHHIAVHFTVKAWRQGRRGNESDGGREKFCISDSNSSQQYWEGYTDSFSICRTVCIIMRPPAVSALFRPTARQTSEINLQCLSKSKLLACSVFRV